MYRTTGANVHTFELAATPPGSVGFYWLHIVNNKIGEPVRVPFMVARGAHDGPTLGLTAAVHGNELNGIPVIQRLFAQIDVTKLRGNVVGVLAVNVPGVLIEQRGFNDGTDLNRIAPGDKGGGSAALYVHRVVERLIRHFDYLIDLHTASFGRVNAHYVRADMDDAAVARVARLQMPQIIVHNAPGDHTLRGAASTYGVKAITVELRDPHVFQDGVVENSLLGVNNTLYGLQMIEGSPHALRDDTILCRSSYWMHTDEGGILKVLPEVGQRVRKGQRVAEVMTIFGQITKRYVAPEAGIVVGRSINPLNQTGSRIIHLGCQPKKLASRSA